MTGCRQLASTNAAVREGRTKRVRYCRMKTLRYSQGIETVHGRPFRKV